MQTATSRKWWHRRLAGGVTIFFLIGGWLYELAQGRDGSPYTQILAVTGVSYMLAVAFFRWRS